MYRNFLFSCAALVCCGPSLADDAVRGVYVEARTCQVYTGPCFANGEVGLTGKDAILVWRIDQGRHAGVDLAGRSVAIVIEASHTLGFNGLDDAKVTRGLVIVDQRADQDQALALQEFALSQTGLGPEDLAAVETSDIELTFDFGELTAEVEVGRFAHLQTRKARKGDCICSNESAYYPPLTKLKGFVPGVTIEGEVSARRLGTQWSIPDSRTAYLGTFEVDRAKARLASLH